MHILIIVNLPDSSASPYDVHRIFGFSVVVAENSIDRISHYRERISNIPLTGSIEQKHVAT